LIGKSHAKEGRSNGYVQVESVIGSETGAVGRR